MRSILTALEERLDEPSSRALATAVSRAVADEALTAGTKLPPIRTVARELTLSPTTVSGLGAPIRRSYGELEARLQAHLDLDLLLRARR
jgi:DNA-binding transcriptional regulator YhcF (GntR family)